MCCIKFMPRPRTLHLRLLAAIAIAAVALIFDCMPLWSYSPESVQAIHRDRLADGFESAVSDHLWISKKNRSHEAGDGERLSPQEEERMRKKYKEWQSLPPEEKEVIRQRMEQWKKMSPRDRELYKRRYQQWHNLSPDERRKLQKDLENWERLSPQQQDAIRRRFMN